MTYKHERRRPSFVWVLVADRARARLFQGKWPDWDDFTEIETMVHPEGASHPRDLETDGPGRFRVSEGPAHAGDAETDFKHRTAVEFAVQVVKCLEQGRVDNAFGRLVIVAPPLFLGVLRERLPAPLRSWIVAELDKNFTQADAEAILKTVRQAVSAESSFSA